MSNIKTFDQLSEAKGLKLVHLNVRSLVRKIDQLRLTLQNSKIDIITISETWLTPKVDSKLVSIDGLDLHRFDRDPSLSKKRGDGLIVYLNQKTNLEAHLLYEASISNADIEMQWLNLKAEKSRNILLCNVYRPPNGKVPLAIKHLDNTLQSLRRQNSVDIFMLGDLNIDYTNKTAPSYKKLKFVITSNSLKQIITTTTRNTVSSSSLIDLILTNSSNVRDHGTLDTYISDHQPIFAIRKKLRDKSTGSATFTGRSYRNYNKQEFIDNLNGVNWAPFYGMDNVDEAWDVLLAVILREADKKCPIKTFKIHNYRPPWMVDELLEQVKDRDYFYKKAKKSRNEDDWNIAKFLRNLTNKNIRKSKADFIKDQLEINEGNCSRFWRTIQQVMPNNKSKDKKTHINLVDDTGTHVKEKDTANYINQFFTQVGIPGKDTIAALARKNDPSHGPTAPPTTTLDDELEDDIPPFDFQKLRNFDVLKILKSINTSKSSGITHLSSRLLKDALIALLPQITHLFNLSLVSGIFPTLWKEELVIPIPKKGDLTKVGNFRPISLLPLPGKVLEKLVHTQLSHHCESNDIISDKQFGFRPQKSTLHATSQFLNQVYTNINRSAITAAVYIDFRKAFDCVLHPALIEKLECLNLSPESLALITNYLHQRKQRTFANNTYSSYTGITQGVPQGSVLGPLFYILYANDTASCIQKSGYTFYADDTVLYTTKESLSSACANLQSDLNNLQQWCTLNNVHMNLSKTKCMFFGSRTALGKAPLPSFKVNEETIQRVNKYTYLGIKLDEQLNFETHSSSTINTVTNKIYQLCLVRPFINKESSITNL